MIPCVQIGGYTKLRKRSGARGRIYFGVYKRVCYFEMNLAIDIASGRVLKKKNLKKKLKL
jgi:hypothetical protein